MASIRPARPEDVDGILEVGRVTWVDAYTALAGEEYVRRGLELWWTSAGTLAAIGGGRVWVAEDAGAITGMVMYGATDRTVEIWKLYVRPESQHGGLGRGLLAAVIDTTRGSADRITLAHMAGNEAARRFYEGQGFVETGRSSDELGGPESVWMELDLEGRPSAEPPA